MTETKATSGGLAHHGLVMAAGSLVSRITGFGRTVVIAAALGATVLGNSYTTAQYFPQMIYEVVLGGVLTSVLVPLIVRARKNDADGGEAFTHRLLTLCVLALAAATVCLTAAAPLLAAAAGGAENRDLITSLSYFMLPAIFFYGMCALTQAVLNTRDSFAAPMWAPIVNNVVIIAVGLVFFTMYTSDEAIAADDVTTSMVLLLGLGTLSGLVFQALILLPAARKVGFRWKWRFDFRQLHLSHIAKLGGWIFCYVALNQVSMVVLIKVANLAADSSPDEQAKLGPIIYNNAYLIMMMAHGIVAVSIITALMPRLSAAADDGRYEDLKDDLSGSMRMSTLLLTPIAVGYAALGIPLAVLLFGWGAYTDEAASVTGVVIALAGIALIPFAVSQLQIFAFYSMTDGKTVALINIPVATLRMAASGLAFVLLPVEHVVAGLMAANGLSYVLAVVLSTVFLRRRIGPLGMRRIVTSWTKQLIAAAAALIAVWSALLALPGADAGRISQIWVLAAGGAVLLVVYFGAAYLLRLGEITQAVRTVRAKFGR
ncbi:MAG: murein biosynthesis integral membrane protein MurJ [Stackebrandtia sp.]